MSIIVLPPSSKEAVFVQRDDANTAYGEIHVSGSEIITYFDVDGHLVADKIGNFIKTYGSGSTSLSSSWASSSISSSYSLTSSDVPYNGNRTIKRSPYTTLNVGGTDVVQFLNNFFFPFVPATIAISSGGTYYYETGSSQNFVVDTVLTLNDEVLVPLVNTGSVLKNSTLWNTIVGSQTLTDTGVSSSNTYQSFFYVNNNGSPTTISSNTRAISFIYPYLWGTSSIAGLNGVDLYSNLIKTVQTSGTKIVNLTGSSTYIYFAFPSSYTSLTSIKDPNLFETLSSFDFSSSVSVTSVGLLNNWTNTYKVYRLTALADPNGNFTFS
jgi:hypothetical protein